MKVRNSKRYKNNWIKRKATSRMKSQPGEMKKTQIFTQLNSHKRQKGSPNNNTKGTQLMN